jgi:hypothetical protein
MSARRFGVAALVVTAVLGGAGRAEAARPMWAHAGFRPCAQEDSAGPCYWDAKTRGNGVGVSFWVDARQRVHYPTR